MALIPNPWDSPTPTTYPDPTLDDYIHGLSQSYPFEGHTTIFMVVDSLTKMAYFIVAQVVSATQETMKLFSLSIFWVPQPANGNVWQRPAIHVSLLEGMFWATESKTHNFICMQPTGQWADRVNQTLKQYLCCFISYHQNDWLTQLPSLLIIMVTYFIPNSALFFSIMVLTQVPTPISLFILHPRSLRSCNLHPSHKA